MIGKVNILKGRFFLYILAVLIIVLMSVLNCGESFKDLFIILVIIHAGL